MNRLRLLSEISDRLATAPTPDEFFPFFLQNLCKGTGAADAYLQAERQLYMSNNQKSTESVLALSVALHQHVPLPITDGSQLPFDTAPYAAVAAQQSTHGVVWLGFQQMPADTAELQDFIQAAVSQASLLSTNTFDLPFGVIVTEGDTVQMLNQTALEILEAENGLGKPLVDVLPEPFMALMHSDKVNPMVEWGDESYQIYRQPLPMGNIIVLTNVSHFKRLHENMTIFLQTVSHDLRSPLTAAKGFIDMLSMVGELNDKQAMMKDKILTSIVDMTNLVEKVLDAGRLDPEMGIYELRRETSDPMKVVEKVASTLTPAAQKKNLQLKTEIGQGIPIMNLDEMLVERALVNLVENAIKYTPEGGEVVVRASVDDNHLIFEVKDNGYGIPPEKLETIFERGSRIRRDEHKAIRGSGLGLFIVKNVAEQHGGDATVESEEGQGSAFRIAIPIAGANMIGSGS